MPPVPMLEKEGALRFEQPAPSETVTFQSGDRTGRRRHAAPLLLTSAALALAIVGMIMNGWFARSLGSTEIAAWLFLAIGVAADRVALVIPSCAAGLWQARQRARRWPDGRCGR